MNRIHHRLDVPHTTCRHDCRLSACLPPTTLTHRRAAAKSRTSMRRPRAAYSATRRRRAERGGRPATYDCTRWFQLQVRHTSTTCTENSSAVVSRREISSVVRADPTPGRVSRRTPTRPTSRALCGRSGRASNWGDRGTSRRAGDKDSRRRPRPRQPARNGPATAAIAAGGRSRRSGVAREPAYVVDIGVVGVTCPSIRACRDHDRHPQVEADIDSVYIGAIHWAKASARRTIGEGVSGARNGDPRPPARIPHARL